MSIALWGLALTLCAAMRIDDLLMLHRLLRYELEAAYAAQPWDGVRIACIAADLLQLERSLAECQRHGQREFAAEASQPIQAALGRCRNKIGSAVPHAAGLSSSRLDAWGKEHR
jgi:hypothetical protein